MALSKILSNGLKALSSTERFGKTVVTKTNVLNKEGKVVISRVKRTFPGQAEFRSQETYYHLGGNLKTGVMKEFAALEKDIFGKPKYIQEATYVKSPSAIDWKDAGANNLYDWGQGYYA